MKINNTYIQELFDTELEQIKQSFLSNPNKLLNSWDDYSKYYQSDIERNILQSIRYRMMAMDKTELRDKLDSGDSK